VIIGIANDAIWERFLDASGFAYLGEDERYNSNSRRVENHEPLREIIQEWTTTLKVDEVVRTLTDHGVPSCQIYNIKEAAEDPHIGIAREMIIHTSQPGLGKVSLLGNPVKMSETQPQPRGPAPSLGADTAVLLKELLGITENQIDKLRSRNVL